MQVAMTDSFRDLGKREPSLLFGVVTLFFCSQLENVLENLEKIHPEFHHFEDLVKALDECANRETILHIEISPLVKDHREFLNEQPRVTASGSRHVHFALEPPEIMDV